MINLYIKYLQRFSFNKKLYFMDYGLILFIGGITLILWAVILYNIILSATDTRKRNKLLQANNKLLALIADKLGADVTTINKIISEMGK